MRYLTSPRNRRRSLIELNEKSSSQSAFALVIALSLMAFILLLLLGIVTFVQVETRNAAISKQQLESRQAALLALNLAIGDLQKVAGHDQRVTAPADILFQNSSSAEQGRAHWYGVWDTSDYDPSVPDSKTFVRWLVSSPNTTSPTVGASDISEVSNAATSSDVTIFEGVDADSSVQVPKVAIEDNTSHPKFYAYWVDDEGVKANLNWNEGTFADDERSQVARLASSGGGDFGVFEGPFLGQVSYPIEFGGANTWLEDLDKVATRLDLSALTGASVDSFAWLREKRHDITLGTFGLLTDVKNGGLRADLSIAFEMDGDSSFVLNSSGTDFVEVPDRFIKQYGVFSGEDLADDIFTSWNSVGSDDVIARYVYADTNTAGFTFSSDLIRGTDSRGTDLTIRGPSWFALREFANMYKQLSGSSGDYELGARAYIPQNSNFPQRNATIKRHFASLNGSQGFVSLADLENPQGLYDRYYIDAGNGHHIERPFQNNFVPVLLGVASTLSVTSVTSGANETLAVSIDPIFFLWNPYNHRLTADRMGVGFRLANPGALSISYDGGVARVADIDELLSQSANLGIVTGNNRFTLAMTDIELEPGEVKIYYPTSDTSRLSDSSRHPYNTEAFEKDSDVISTDSGLLITYLPRPSGGAGQVRLDEFNDIRIAHGFKTAVESGRIHLFMGDPSEQVSIYHDPENWGLSAYSLNCDLSYFSSSSSAFVFEPNVGIGNISSSDAIYFSKASIDPGTDGIRTKQFFGAFSLLNSPAGSSLNPTEIFAQFNPLPLSSHGNYNESRVGAWNQESRSITRNFADHSLALESVGVVLPFDAGALSNGYWGANYGNSSGFGSTHVPMIDIPTAPIVSLAQFSHANIGMRTNAPLHAVGNSFASVFVDPVSPYDELDEDWSLSPDPINAEDVSWLINDALFDGYYLSGIAPDFNISGSGYSTNGKTIKDTLELFYEETGSDFRTAQTNPVLVPYLPDGKSASEIVNELDPDTGNLDPQSDATCYQRVGAYSLIGGAFNVNSTSVAAWAALLRANRGLDVDFVDGSSDSDGSATPFPRGTLPVDSSGSEAYWSGLKRLSDDDIWDDAGTPNDTSDDSGLAFDIVNQVKLRGPFMSLSDFVNHRVGSPKKDTTHYLGALQAAIEESGINSDVESGAGGVDVNYASSNFSSSMSNPISGTRKSTTGIYTDITQADLLMPLAPRLSARSDTFRVRGYGEVRSPDGSTVVAQSVCEAVLQRIPDYLNTVTDPSNNEAWDTDSLNTINEAFGRRFKVVQFRWLDPNEI